MPLLGHVLPAQQGCGVAPQAMHDVPLQTVCPLQALQAPPQPSEAPPHLPTQFGMQLQVPAIHDRFALQVLLAQQDCPDPPQLVHVWPIQTAPEPQAPLQAPPQPSGAPPHLFAQLGTQVHDPLTHDRLALQTLLAQQGCPDAPQLPHTWLLQTVPPGHAPLQVPLHPSDAPPHLFVQFGMQPQKPPTQERPPVQALFAQQGWPDAPQLTHPWFAQIVPAAHAPLQAPPHPSDAPPHLFVQSGTQPQNPPTQDRFPLQVLFAQQTCPDPPQLAQA